MQLVRGLHNLRSQHRGCVATIGNFDGVHCGHQAILARLRERAAALGVPACVVIFEPHPRAFFHPEETLFELTPLDRKLALLEAMGLKPVPSQILQAGLILREQSHELLDPFVDPGVEMCFEIRDQLVPNAVSIVMDVRIGRICLKGLIDVL